MDNRIFVIGRDSVPALITLRDGEKAKLTFVSLPGVSEKVCLEVDIEGSGCSVDIGGVYVCDADDNINFKVLIRHSKGGSTSRQMFKGLVSGRAKAVFDGLIYVAPDAQKTVAYQENRSILLSDTARVESLPQLEIYADDVECSHGSTSGFLDLEEQFYMRSRGIPEEEARYFQKVAFLAPILKRVPDNIAKAIYDSIS